MSSPFFGSTGGGTTTGFLKTMYNAKMKEMTTRTPRTPARIEIVVWHESVAGAAEAVGGTVGEAVVGTVGEAVGGTVGKAVGGGVDVGKASFKSLPVTIFRFLILPSIEG